MLYELRRLALLAGAKIMAIYRQDDLGVEIKGDTSPVTTADLAANRVIVEGLAKAFPGIPIVTEEETKTHNTHAAGRRFFLVDPLDGTREFINRHGEFTVNIALIEAGVPVAGVVYAPSLGRLFIGSRSGAWQERNPQEQPEFATTQALLVRRADNNALAVVASKSHRDAATDAYIDRYAVAEFKSAGSSLKFCLVAAGEADLYPRLGRTMEWDTAAGHAVLLAAGGHVDALGDGRGSTPLAYGKAGFENPHFIAYSPAVRLKQAG